MLEIFDPVSTPLWEKQARENAEADAVNLEELA
jgi:hypothetical protein